MPPPLENMVIKILCFFPRKEIKQLLSELDEEKKIRLRLQVLVYDE